MSAPHAALPVERSPHPATGFHYTHIVPAGAYDDARRALRALSSVTKWVSVAAPEQYESVARQATERDMLIVWGWGLGAWGTTVAPVARGARRYRVALHYGETLGDPELLTAPQRKMLENMLSVAAAYDTIFVHTPSAQRWLAGCGVEAHLAPLGYSPEVFGRPDWETKKQWDAVHYGARLGRRLGMPKIARSMKKKCKLIYVFGDERQACLQRSRSVLQLHHCDASCSFASLRLWQAIGTSATLLMEPCDAWPALGGRHYVELPVYQRGSEREFAKAVDEVLAQDVAAIARCAHEELSAYTPARMMEEFIVPISVRP